MKVIDLIIKQFNFELKDKTIFRILNQTGHNKYIYNIDDNQFNEYRDRGGELKNISLVIDNETVNWDIEIIEEDNPTEELDLIEKINNDLNFSNNYSKKNIKNNMKYVANKINELVDEINKLKKESDM